MANNGSKSVVDQVIVAFQAKNRLATVMGFLLGGIVPVATYLEAHVDLDASLPLYSQVAAYLVLGGLLYSAKTVYAWAKQAFESPAKAAGFVVLLEGVMIASTVPVLPLVLLAFLVAINGVATGCTLSLGRTVPHRRARKTPVSRKKTAPKGVRKVRKPEDARPSGIRKAA